jgi:PadR family transcriptional regulator, regulatory protein AphA
VSATVYSHCEYVKGCTAHPARRPHVKKLTSTSYAVLGLIAVRPSTAYELARQISRSLEYVWPRAEGRIYDEPKLLVQHGLATATPEHTGRRPRTVYAITAKGRRELKKWLAEPGAKLQLEYEALLKVVFAEHGSRQQLLANLAVIEEQARLNLAVGTTLAEEYLDGQRPFPERVAINGLLWNFLWVVHRSIADWARWAQEEVAQWPDDLAVTPEILERMLGSFRQALDGA